MEKIKELREKTGAGIMDCKRALEASERRYSGRGGHPAQARDGLCGEEGGP